MSDAATTTKWSLVGSMSAQEWWPTWTDAVVAIVSSDSTVRVATTSMLGDQPGMKKSRSWSLENRIKSRNHSRLREFTEVPAFKRCSYHLERTPEVITDTLVKPISHEQVRAFQFSNHSKRGHLEGELSPFVQRIHDVVQALARHEDLKTTQRYADLDADDLRSAIDLLDRHVDQGNASTLTKGSV